MGSIGGRYFVLSPTDRALALIDRRSRMTYHLVVELSGRVEPELLAAAWGAAGERHAILRSVVDPRRSGARWRPGDARPSFAALGDAGTDRSSSGVVSELVERSLSVESGPVAQLSLVQCEDGDVLVISAHHAAIDGPAALMLADELRSDCWRLDQGAEPDRRPDPTPRTLGEAVDRAGLDVRTRRAALAEAVGRWSDVSRSGHAEPRLPQRPAAERHTLPAAATEAISTLRATGRWSVTGSLLLASDLAWDVAFGDPSSDDRWSAWLITADLRRRLSMAGGLGNLSGVEPIALAETRAARHR